MFDADRAEMLGKEQGLKVILVREETKPEDIHGFLASAGILTSRGGKISHGVWEAGAGCLGLPTYKPASAASASARPGVKYTVDVIQ